MDDQVSETGESAELVATRREVLFSPAGRETGEDTVVLAVRVPGDAG